MPRVRLCLQSDALPRDRNVGLFRASLSAPCSTFAWGAGSCPWHNARFLWVGRIRGIRANTACHNPGRNLWPSVCCRTYPPYILNADARVVRS